MRGPRSQSDPRRPVAGAPQAPDRGPGQDPERHPDVRLSLTEEQQRAIVDATGVLLGALGYTAAEAAGVALLAAATAAGHRSPATDRLTRLDLTVEQSQVLQDCLGGPAPALWLVDADHTSVRYGEEWAADSTFPLGQRGLVVPPGVADPPADHNLVVRLPQVPEGADVFGTGRHAATQLAALLLEEHVRPGADVIDVGTGSGVLAVFALHLGASHVRAFDTSPTAVDAARRTFELNGCTGRVDLVLGELDDTGPPADLVVANILAGVLLDLLPVLAANVRLGGHLVTSGVVEARAPDVVAAAYEHGLHHSASSTLRGWTASIFHRR